MGGSGRTPRESTQAQGEHENSTQKGPRSGTCGLLVVNRPLHHHAPQHQHQHYHQHRIWWKRSKSYMPKTSHLNDQRDGKHSWRKKGLWENDYIFIGLESWFRFLFFQARAFVTFSITVSEICSISDFFLFFNEKQVGRSVSGQYFKSQPLVFACVIVKLRWGGETVSNGFLNMDDSSLWTPLFAILLALNNSPVKLEAREEQLYYPTFGCAAPSYHNIIL